MRTYAPNERMEHLRRAIERGDHELASFLANLILDEKFPGRWP